MSSIEESYARRHQADSMICVGCFGSGVYVPDIGYQDPSKPCFMCDGTGTVDPVKRREAEETREHAQAVRAKELETAERKIQLFQELRELIPLARACLEKWSSK